MNADMKAYLVSYPRRSISRVALPYGRASETFAAMNPVLNHPAKRVSLSSVKRTTEYSKEDSDECLMLEIWLRISS